MIHVLPIHYPQVHEANLYNSGGITITSSAEVAGAGQWSENLVLPIKKSATATSELFSSKVANPIGFPLL